MLTERDRLQQAWLEGYIEGSMDGYSDGMADAEYRQEAQVGATRRQRYGIWALVALSLAGLVGCLMRALGIW